MDTNPAPARTDGTISGSVRGPDNTAPAAGRMVRAVSIESGQVFEARTNETGGYTIKVPPGRYRLELTLLPGERLLEQPGEVQIDASDLDPGQDFVLAGAGVAQPQ